MGEEEKPREVGIFLELKVTDLSTFLPPCAPPSLDPRGTEVNSSIYSRWLDWKQQDWRHEVLGPKKHLSWQCMFEAAWKGGTKKPAAKVDIFRSNHSSLKSWFKKIIFGIVFLVFGWNWVHQQYLLQRLLDWASMDICWKKVWFIVCFLFMVLTLTKGNLKAVLRTCTCTRAPACDVK